MSEATPYDEDDDDGFGVWDGRCQACDAYGRVNDISLCEKCSERVERDLVRLRYWDHSARAFGLPPEDRERLRREIVREHGEKLEMLADPSRPKPWTRRRPGRAHPPPEPPPQL